MPWQTGERSLAPEREYPSWDVNDKGSFKGAFCCPNGMRTPKGFVVVSQSMPRHTGEWSLAPEREYPSWDV